MRRSCAWSAAVLIAGCSGESGGPSPDPDELVALQVEPSGGISLDGTTTLQFRATGVTRSGRLVPVEGVVWTLDDVNVGNEFGGELGAIDADGLYTPPEVAVGDASIQATLGDLEGGSYVTFVSPGWLEVAVAYEFQTGELQAPAEVRVLGTPIVGVGTRNYGGQNIVLEGDFTGPVDLHISAPNHVPLTVFGVRNRRPAFSLRRIGSLGADITFTGQMDFSSLAEPDASEVRIGIGGASFPNEIVAIDVDRLLGTATRNVVIDGSTVAAPDGVFIEGVTPYYRARSETFNAAFGLSASVPVSTLTSVAFPDAIRSALAEFDSHARGATTADADLELHPNSSVAAVSIGARPCAGTEVVAGVDMGQDPFAENGGGFVPTGLSGVDSAAPIVLEMPVARSTGVLEDRLYSFVASCRNEEQESSVLSRRLSHVDEVVMPEFLALPSLATFTSTGATLSFGYEPIAGADLVLHRFVRETAEGHREWDVITRGDVGGFVLPMVLATNAAQSGATWTATGIGLESQTYESGIHQAFALPSDGYRRVTSTVPVN
jgi:hypothetical protein